MNSKLHSAGTNSLKASSRPSWLPTAIRLVVGFTILAFLFFRYADLRQVWQIIRAASPAHLVFALFLAISGEIITAWKWRRLVAFIHGQLPILKAIRVSFVGMFYNNFFPGSVGGDIVRVVMISREAGGKARAAASAFMQRNTGLAGLFFVGLPAAFLWPLAFSWPGISDHAPLPQWLLDCRLWITAALAGYIAVNLALFSRPVYRRLWNLDAASSHERHRVIHRLLVFVLSKLRRFHEEIQGYRFWLPQPLAISALTQLIDVFLVYTYAQALGITLPFHVAMLIVPMVSLVNLIPITINGIGLRETVYIGLLAGTGISANQAMALSLVQFGMIITLAIGGGIIHAFLPQSRTIR